MLETSLGVRRRTNSFKKWLSTGSGKPHLDTYACVNSTDSLTELANPESEQFSVELIDQDKKTGIEIILDIAPDGIRERKLKTKQVEQFYPIQAIADYGFNGNQEAIQYFFISAQTRPGAIEKRIYSSPQNAAIFDAFRNAVAIALQRVKERTSSS